MDSHLSAEKRYLPFEQLRADVAPKHVYTSNHYGDQTNITKEPGIVNRTQSN